jgi:hypothetical protein
VDVRPGKGPRCTDGASWVETGEGNKPNARGMEKDEMDRQDGVVGNGEGRTENRLTLLTLFGSCPTGCRSMGSRFVRFGAR